MDNGTYSPNIFDLRKCRIYKTIFGSFLDGDYFRRKGNSKRNYLIRQAYKPEYEWAGELSWLLVAKLSPDTLMAMPIWCGQAFFPVSHIRLHSFADVTSDNEIAAIVEECARRLGAFQS